LEVARNNRFVSEIEQETLKVNDILVIKPGLEGVGIFETTALYIGNAARDVKSWTVQTQFASISPLALAIHFMFGKRDVPVINGHPNI
jgi:hypothetical protein